MQELWAHCQQMNVHIVPHYVLSVEKPADLSRTQNSTLAAASMDLRTMAILRRRFFWMDTAIDWMPNAENVQCQKSIADCPQPGAWGVDLFTH